MSCVCLVLYTETCCYQNTCTKVCQVTLVKSVWAVRYSLLFCTHDNNNLLMHSTCTDSLVPGHSQFFIIEKVGVAWGQGYYYTDTKAP